MRAPPLGSFGTPFPLFFLSFPLRTSCERSSLDRVGVLYFLVPFFANISSFNLLSPPLNFLLNGDLRFGGVCTVVSTVCFFCFCSPDFSPQVSSRVDPICPSFRSSFFCRRRLQTEGPRNSSLPPLEETRLGRRLERSIDKGIPSTSHRTDGKSPILRVSFFFFPQMFPRSKILVTYCRDEVKIIA